MAPPMAIKDSDSLIALIAEASMNSMDRSERYARLSLLAAVLELLRAVGALGGGLALMLGPNGEILPAPLSLVQESAFTNNFTPGLILFVALGCGPLMVALLVWRRHLWAPALTIVVGLALVVWMADQTSVPGPTRVRLAGRPLSEALQLLESRGLNVMATSSPSCAPVTVKG